MCQPDSHHPDRACHGLSASEVGLLTRSDVRLAKGWIRIPRLKHPASEYPLLPAEIRALRAWFRFRGRGPGPLYPSRHRSPISRRRLDSLMKQYCRMAGIAAAKAHFHVLKQSCAEHVRERLERAQRLFA